MMNAVLRYYHLVLIVVFVSGCAVTGTYTAPRHYSDPGLYTIILEKPYDQVWKDLIQHLAGTFFAIDNYEKDSGLITLSFGLDKPSQFVDGGYFEIIDDFADLQYKGPYVYYLRHYRGGTLTGKMNIVVTKNDDQKTKVAVHARYVFSVPPNPQAPSMVWAFTSGNCDTFLVQKYAAGANNERTMCPTYKAEKFVLKALK